MNSESFRKSPRLHWVGAKEAVYFGAPFRLNFSEYIDRKIDRNLTKWNVKYMGLHFYKNLIMWLSCRYNKRKNTPYFSLPLQIKRDKGVALLIKKRRC